MTARTDRLLMAITVILGVGAMSLARPLLVPIAVASLVAFLLRPIVRLLKDRGLPEAAGAAITVFGTMALVAMIAVMLASPAADWLRRAPAEITRIESKLRRLARPFVTIRQTAERVERATGGGEREGSVAVESGGPLRQIGWTTASAATTMLTSVFLTYFLLATGTTLRRKVSRILADDDHRDAMEEALTEIEKQISRYLLFNTFISASVGVATYVLMRVIGMPNPLLWAACAFVLNYIPYLGAIVTMAIIGAAALVSFEGLGQAFGAMGGFLVINLLEAYLVTPALLGRKLPLNSVAIFIALLFWGWVWGIPGAIMAVPLTVTIQVLCTHVKRLHPVAVLLDS